EQTAVAWAVRNRARRRHVSIAQLVCSPTCGPQGPTRPFSSAQAATAHARQLARYVLSQLQSADPTGGAWSFIEPELQDSQAISHPQTHRPYAMIRERWIRGGERP